MEITQKKTKGSIFGLIRSSLSSENQDYTTGSIRKAILLISIPMVLEMCMESIFAVVDIFFVGRIGKEAVTTVALTESVLTLLYSMAIGLSMAATAMVARRIGEKNPVEASKSAAQALLLGIGIDLVTSLIGFLFPGQILGIMGAEKTVITTGASFTRILFGGSMVIMLLYLINGIFRGAGNAFLAMQSLWLANGVNIVLCPIMIYYFGISGAALATTLGRGSGVLFQIYHLWKGGSAIQILRSYFTPNGPILKSLTQIASTGTAQFLVGSASWIFMARLIAQFGSATVAGYQVSIRILLFFLLPAWGMSNAAATLVGQNLGAKKPDRAEESVWKTAKYNTAFMFLVTLIFLFFSPAIVGLINKDPEVQKIAIEGLHIITLGYIFYGIGMVMTNAFNGAGDTRTPTLINLFCFWVFQIPIAYLLANYWHWGPEGVFYSIIMAETLIAIVAFVLFRGGRWKLIKI